MTHGGTRPNAGRKKSSVPSKVVRLPAPLADAARRLASADRGDVGEFLSIDLVTSVAVPLASSHAQAGFPSPADDHLERALDFNELLVAHPAATFAVKITGESMTGIGLFPGDIAVVDRSITVSDGRLVLALLNGEFTIKRFRREKSGPIRLEAENASFPTLEVGGEDSFEVWGVVRNTIRMSL